MNWGRSIAARALLAVVCAACLAAQEKAEPTQNTQPQTPGVVSTGGAHAAVFDSEKRPITAGGFVDNGPVIFQDISEKAGLTRWRHVMGTPEDAFIIETVGSGVALLDYDNDGWLDIYLGKPLRPMQRCFTTTTMGPLQTSRSRLASPMIAGVSA